uniref:C2H2-type domain-containing protein n=1 Tax=Plectus sambesii TaxID=2011161 RepID=A0A914XKD7_9BILA
MRSTASSSSTSNNHGNELGLNQEVSTTGLSKELRDNAMEHCGTEASTSSEMMRKTVGKSNEANTQDTNDQHKPKKSISPIPDDPDVTIVQEKPRAAVTAQSLLNRIEATVLLFARAEGNNNQRKLTDVIMQALNQEVQRDPQGVQKILADKELRLPTAVTIPPSQVVDLLVEYEPDVTLRRVLTKLYGDLKIKITDNERKERDHLRQTTPAPHMARLMLSIGQDLVQEATYSDIVHARNLPEAPRNEDTYKQVAAQLRPVLDALRAKNEPYKTKTHRCHLCSFRSDSLLVLAQHKHMPHNDGRKFLCALCPDFDTSERRIRKHYLKKHNIIATEEDHGPRAPCPCCDMDFQYKGQRDMHLKSCKRNYVRDRLAPTADDVATVSRWLWEKPPEPLVNHPFAVQAPPTARPGQLPYSHGLRLMSLAPAGPGVSTQRMVVPAGGTTGPRFLSNSRLLAPFQQHQQPQSAQQQQQNAINAAAQQQRIQQLLVQRQQNTLGSPQFPPITGIRAVGNTLTPRMPVRPPNKPIEPRPATHAKTLAEALAVHPVDRQNRPIPAALYAQHQ